jgi:hypothetical protein
VRASRPLWDWLGGSELISSVGGATVLILLGFAFGALTVFALGIAASAVGFAARLLGGMAGQA